MRAINGNSYTGSHAAIKSLRSLKRLIRKQQHGKGVEVVDAAIDSIECGGFKEAILTLERSQFLEMTIEQRMLAANAIDLLRSRRMLKLELVTSSYIVGKLYQLAVEHSLKLAVAEAVTYLASFLISFHCPRGEQINYKIIY
ncbi:MAG: hypothetical protein GVY36_16800 [Verrucomicrobia bacterium]|jgi:hypothetical protein|nr:hypothetical protein [Verrucomicrobiota bacterium]